MPPADRGPMYSPEHIDSIRQTLAVEHPLQGLVKERQQKLYAEAGGRSIEIAIEGLQEVIELGRRCLAAEAKAPPLPDGAKRPRPLVTAGELVRATAELRRWLDKRERLLEEALLQVTDDIQTMREQVKEAFDTRRPNDNPDIGDKRGEAPTQSQTSSPQTQSRAPTSAAA